MIARATPLCRRDQPLLLRRRRAASLRW